MRFLILVLLSPVISFSCYSQPLTAEIEVGQIPLCRTSSIQTGKGLLLGRANGGTGNVSFGWYYGSNFDFVGNTPTLNTRNPGEYHLVIKDNSGNSVLTSVVLDSINPIASFKVNSNEFIQPYILEAYDSAQVRFVNTSPGFTNIIGPPFHQDTFQWNFDVNNDTSKWFLTHDADVWPQTTFYPGSHKTCLIVKNFNNCVDTTCKTISVIDSEGEITVNIAPNYMQNTLSFSTKNTKIGDQFQIFDLQGRLVSIIAIGDQLQWNQINFNHARGAYLYSIVSNQETVASGKFVF